MDILAYIALFFGGAFLVNAIPHFVHGVSGKPFPSPFSKPPGRGSSRPVVNVLWGALNAVIGYVLLRLGGFQLLNVWHVVVVGLGGLAMGLMLAHGFGQVYYKRAPK